jgi:hypothetical protein
MRKLEMNVSNLEVKSVEIQQKATIDWLVKSRQSCNLAEGIFLPPERIHNAYATFQKKHKNLSH